MNVRRRFEIVRSAEPQAAPSAPEARPRRLLVGAGALALLGLACSLLLHVRIGAGAEALERAALARAARVFEGTLQEKRASLAAMVGVLADDTRVRASVMTPNFDEATVKDTLDELKRSAGASVLAVLDLSGKVRVVTGADELRNLDLGSSAVVREAAVRPATYVWTLPQKVLVIGVAPIHSGDAASALFMIGFSVGTQALKELRDKLDVESAVLIGDRVAAQSTQDPALAAAVRAAAAMDADGDFVVPGARDYRVRHVRGGGAAGARFALLLPRGAFGEELRGARVLAFGPALLGILALFFVGITSRSGSTGLGKSATGAGGGVA